MRSFVLLMTLILNVPNLTPCEAYGQLSKEVGAQGPVGDRGDKTSSFPDPTIPSDAILARAIGGSKPIAKDLLDSARRLHKAGLTNQAKQRIDQLMELENAPIKLQDEATVWWSTVSSKKQLLDSAKRLYEAGLIRQAQQRIDELKGLDDVPLDVLDEAMVWWAKIAPNQQNRSLLPATAQGRQTASLPDLPQISLRGSVLSTQDSGTAILNVDGREITISLKTPEQQVRIPIPQSQFMSMRRAIEQRDRGFAARTSTSLKPRDFEMSLSSSFVHESVIYNLQAFTEETVVLEALPHNELIIVRGGGQ